MEQTIKWVKGDRPEKEGVYLVYGKVIKQGKTDWQIIKSKFARSIFLGEISGPEWREYVSDMIIEYYAEIIGPNGEKYE